MGKGLPIGRMKKKVDCITMAYFEVAISKKKYRHVFETHRRVRRRAQGNHYVMERGETAMIDSNGKESNENHRLKDSKMIFPSHQRRSR